MTTRTERSAQNSSWTQMSLINSDEFPLEDELGEGLVDDEGYILFGFGEEIESNTVRAETQEVNTTDDIMADFDYTILLDFDDEQLEANLNSFGTNRSERL